MHVPDSCKRFASSDEFLGYFSADGVKERAEGAG